MTTYTFEQKCEIWNDTEGTRIEVGLDRDSLGMVEIRRHDQEGKIGERITMMPNEAELVIEALRKVLDIIAKT